MKLSTRFLLSLLPAVATIMAIYAYWALEQREASLVREARNETRAYSAAVGLAFEHAFRDLQFRDMQAIVDEVARRPEIYGLVLYDTLGAPTIRSEQTRAPDVVDPESVREVAATGHVLDFDRSLGHQEVFSVLRPIRGREGRVAGVLEVLQPLSGLEAERARTSERFVLNTLTLLVVLGGLTVWLLHRFVDRPIGEFIEAIRGVGRGDLSRRAPEGPWGGELAAMAREFNRTAESLESARQALLAETEERLLLEQRVREQEKLAALGTLAAGVAHQIAAPLNVIEGRARLLLRGDREDAERKRNLVAIVEQSERITRIVRALLDFARRPEPVEQPVELGRLIEEAARRFEDDLADAGLRFDWETPAPVLVRGDADLLQEVLAILLKNAIEAASGQTQGVVSVRTGRSGTEAWVEVADSGPGVPPETASRVFEPFFTSKPGGTGLGLAVARSVIEGLGGRIALCNAGSAVFRFTLPLAEGERSADPAERPDGAADPPA